MLQYGILYAWIIQERHLITGLFRQKDWDPLWSGRDSVMREVVTICFMHASLDHRTRILAIAEYLMYEAVLFIRWFGHGRGQWNLCKE